MRISEAYPTKYISAPDLQGQNVKVIIERVEMEKVGDDTKPVVYFQHKEKGLVLNKTNANAIAAGYGDETNDWSGGELELFSIMTDFQGKPVEAVRCRLPLRKPAGQQPRQQQTENPGF
jgi:arabinogalactan endo-1,4-beta-galactosidase